MISNEKSATQFIERKKDELVVAGHELLIDDASADATKDQVTFLKTNKQMPLQLAPTHLL